MAAITESVKRQGMSGTIYKRFVKKSTNRKIRREGKQLQENAENPKKRWGYG